MFSHSCITGSPSLPMGPSLVIPPLGPLIMTVVTSPMRGYSPRLLCGSLGDLTSCVILPVKQVTTQVEPLGLGIDDVWGLFQRCTTYIYKIRVYDVRDILKYNAKYAITSLFCV